MKKFLSLLVLLVAFASCEEDVSFNDPAVQALKDDELWKATDFTATIHVGATVNTLVVEAHNEFETLVLKTHSTAPLEYELGINNIDKASYSISADGIEMEYETGTDKGWGVIQILGDPRDTNFTTTAGGYISGKFAFTALDDEDGQVSFQEGYFYRIPVTLVID